MNKQRRKEIEAVKDRLIGLQSDIEMLRDEEQEYKENMPESLQQGEKGDKAQAAIDALEEAIESCETMSDLLGTAQE